MQYFGKGPGFAEPWLSTKTGGGGLEIQELRRDSPKWRSDSNFMLHNRSNLSNPTVVCVCVHLIMLQFMGKLF